MFPLLFLLISISMGTKCPISVVNFIPGGSVQVAPEIPECNSTVKITVDADYGYYVRAAHESIEGMDAEKPFFVGGKTDTHKEFEFHVKEQTHFRGFACFYDYI